MKSIHDIKPPGPSYTGWAYGNGDIVFHYFPYLAMESTHWGGGRPINFTTMPLCGTARQRGSINFQNAHENNYRCAACLDILAANDHKSF